MIDRKPDTADLRTLTDYDVIAVCFSGGKDSLACMLKVLEDLRAEGVSEDVIREKVQLWHHSIDGAPGTDGLMDWPVTEAYCIAVAKAFGLKLLFSWKDGGFEGEMLRKDSTTKGTYYQAQDGSTQYMAPQKPAKRCSDKECRYEFSSGVTFVDGAWIAYEAECPACGKARKGIATRHLFPQVTADLSVRWCSAYLKIDVAKRAINNDPALKDAKILLVTGERAEESTARAKYSIVERHSSTGKKREVSQWRAIGDWSEQQVWDMIGKHSVNPHPAYHLGWGRVSCLACIFGNKDQWASVREMDRDRFNKIASYEGDFGKTIKRNESVVESADKGTVYSAIKDNEGQRRLSMAREYPVEEVIVADWKLPVGAFAVCGGPV